MNSCPICSGTRLNQAWRVEHYTLAHCEACRHLFVAAGLDVEALKTAYEENYYTAGRTGDIGYRDYLADSAKRLCGFAQRLQVIERNVPRRGRLLDFGCAVGFFVKVAVDAGWDAVGFETSSWAAAYGRDNFGLTIMSDADGQCPSFGEPFDVITLWDVLEHLSEPREVIASLTSRLKPGGLLALNTVDSSSYGARRAGPHWRHIVPPVHLQYFTRSSLARLLGDSGFRILSMKSQGVMLTADRRRLTLPRILGAVEELATHWRTRPLAHALHLLDEVDVLATYSPPC